MSLTPDNLELLKAPLPLEAGHEMRVSRELQGGNRAEWLVYTTEQPVRHRLTEVDSNWSMRHVETIVSGKSASVTVELTVNGVTRPGTGSNDSSYNEIGDIVKAAATDALKRAARNFEVGAYLLNSPMIYTDWAPKPGKGASADDRRAAYAKQDRAKKDAEAQFAKWFAQQFGGDNSTSSSKSTSRQSTPRGQKSDAKRIPPASKAGPDAEQGGELDAHFGPSKFNGGQNGDYDPANDESAFTSTACDSLKLHMATHGIADHPSHAANIILKAVAAFNGGSESNWAEIYNAGYKVRDIWQMVQDERAAKAG